MPYGVANSYIRLWLYDNAMPLDVPVNNDKHFLKHSLSDHCIISNLALFLSLYFCLSL